MERGISKIVEVKLRCNKTMNERYNFSSNALFENFIINQIVSSEKTQFVHNYKEASIYNDANDYFKLGSFDKY